jgi:hypothetical protein
MRNSLQLVLERINPIGPGAVNCNVQAHLEQKWDY